MVTAERLATSVWARSRWLIIAPHPDDETLGAGALIAQAARAGRLAGILYLTDGTGSHPAGTARLASIRQAEARLAVRRLAGSLPPLIWLGWQDAHPHGDGSARFDRDAGRAGALLRRLGIDAIAVTGPAESHCDHVAAFALAAAAIRKARRRVALFTYRVWAIEQAPARRRVRTASLAPGHRRRALDAHRSQMSGAYGEGFRIAPVQRRMMAFDILDHGSTAS